MAECPVCNSRLYTQRRFPNIFKKQFICLACGWKMNIEDVHRKGNLDRIKSDLNNHPNHHKHRHHKHNHRHKRK